MKIVSACLAGIKCRWDCEVRPCQKVIELVKQFLFVQNNLGGLTTPKISTEQRESKVITKDGKDVTTEFERRGFRKSKLLL